MEDTKTFYSVDHFVGVIVQTIYPTDNDEFYKIRVTQYPTDTVKSFKNATKKRVYYELKTVLDEKIKNSKLGERIC